MPTSVSSGPSKGVRRLWRIGGSLLTSGALVFAAFQSVVQLAHEEYTAVERFDAADVERIEVDNGAGSVRVVGVGGESDTIRVVADVSDGLQRTRHEETAVDGVLRLRARCPVFTASFCNIRYTIETPPGVDLTVRSNGGVDVADIDGEVDVDAWGLVETARLTGDTTKLHSRDSRVVATALQSPDVAVTSGGDTSLIFEDAPQSVQADADFGSVDITFPDDGAAYQVDAESGMGSVAASGIRTDPDSPRTITAEAFSHIALAYTD